MVEVVARLSGQEETVRRAARLPPADDERREEEAPSTPHLVSGCVSVAIARKWKSLTDSPKDSTAAHLTSLFTTCANLCRGSATFIRTCVDAKVHVHALGVVVEQAEPETPPLARPSALAAAALLSVMCGTSEEGKKTKAALAVWTTGSFLRQGAFAMKVRSFSSLLYVPDGSIVEIVIHAYLAFRLTLLLYRPLIYCPSSR